PAAAPPPRPSSPALEPPPPPARESPAFRLEALPADVEARRALVALQAASAADEQRATIEQLRRLTPALVALRDIGAIAEVVASLDRSLGKIQDPDIQEAIGEVAGALADEAIVERMVRRRGDASGPPAEPARPAPPVERARSGTAGSGRARGPRDITAGDACAQR